MASRGFFGYDPYDYYYTAPDHHYPYPAYYQHQQPAAVRARGNFFPVAEDAGPAVREAAAARSRAPKPATRSVSIPVHFVGSDPEPEREITARKPASAVRKRALPSKEDAAVRIQAAARGLAVRQAVRAVREVEREASEVAEKVAHEAEALRGDARGRIAVGEALMRLLLRLDAVRGAREYRKRVTRRVLALQDAVDALEPKSAPAAEETEAEAAAGEMADEREVVAAVPDATEQSGVTEAATEMEVDGDSAAAGVDQGAAEDMGPASDVADHTPTDAGCGWEMVTDEPAAEAESSSHEALRPKEAAAGEEAKTAAAEPNHGGGVDARKVMEMVAALCERNAQQCAVIGALAERVDALERAVRRVEGAEPRQRRGKKLRKKDGKGSNHSKCYTD